MICPECSKATDDGILLRDARRDCRDRLTAKCPRCGARIPFELRPITDAVRQLTKGEMVDLVTENMELQNKCAKLAEDNARLRDDVRLLHMVIENNVPFDEMRETWESADRARAAFRAGTSPAPTSEAEGAE